MLAAHFNLLPSGLAALFAFAKWRDVEGGLEEFAQAFGGDSGQAAHQAVGGLDFKAFVRHGDQEHEYVSGLGIGFECATFEGGLLLALGQIFQAGLVAVVAIGQKDRFVGNEGSDLVDEMVIGQRPDTGDNPEMVGGLDGQRSTNGLVEEFGYSSGWIRVEAEDRAEVHGGGAEQFEAVGFGARKCLFVGKNTALAKWLELDTRQKALAREYAAIDLEALLNCVDAALGFLQEYVVCQPIPQAGSGAGVAVVEFGIVGCFLVQDEPDNIGWIFGVKLFLQGGVDHIVGGSDNILECANLGKIVPVATKRLNICHETELPP